MQSEYSTAKEACADLKISRNTLERIAKEAQAKVRTGRIVRYSLPKIYEHLNSCAVYHAER